MDLRRVIGDGEAARDGEVEGLDDADLLALHRSLVLLRTYDERSVVYHRQGRIGTYAIFWNHEAMQAGAVHALEPRDWVFPSYRESAIGLLRGIAPATVLSWWRGHPAGWWNPADHNVASICVPIGTHVPHAAGFAWGSKLKDDGVVTVVFFGDGATSEGSFHEGTNLAAVMGAPLILFCNNNQWAISTPLASQTRTEALADKAVGYGIPAIRVDGADVLAVYEATREAAARARSGGGPTFIEAVTYRSAPHGTADDPGAYIDSGSRRGGAADRVPRPLRGLSPPPGPARRRARRAGARGGGRRDARGDRAGGGRARARRGARVRERLRRAAAGARARPRRAPEDPRPCLT